MRPVPERTGTMHRAPTIAETGEPVPRFHGDRLCENGGRLSYGKAGGILYAFSIRIYFRQLFPAPIR